MDREIRRVKQQWQQTFDSVPDLIAILDNEHRMVRVNRAMAQWLGLSAEECVGRKCYECVHGLDAPPDFCPHTKALADGQEHTAEVHEERVKGDFWVSVTPLYENGCAVGSVHVARDITERKRAEQSLRQSEERFHFLAETIPHFVWSARPDGVLDYVNARTLDYVGVPLEQIEGWAWTSALHPEDRQRSIDAWTRALIEGLEHQIEYRFRRASDGQYRWHLGHAMPYRDHEGRIVRWFGTCTDIHDRKCAEDELKQLNETLENRVAEQTAEARHLAAQLRGLVAELGQTEQRERRRLAMALHENLQQLLVAAKLTLNGLRQWANGPEFNSAVEHAEQMIDDCVTESRSVTVQLSPPVLYDGGLVPALEWLGRQMGEEHGLIVAIEADRQAEPADEGVRALLFQAVRELLANIIQHAGVQRAWIEVTKLEGDEVQIAVCDEGAGFDPAALEARVADKGTFGLFGIRERLAAMDGRMELQSLPGDGSRIVLVAPLCSSQRLPSQQIPAGTEKAELDGKVPVKAQATGDRPIRVMLVDDHPVMRNILAHHLRNQPGIEIVGAACDGQEAVEMAMQIRPDVILMDVSMPRMNGIEATRSIKAQLPGVRIIGLSMHEADDLMVAMREAGAVAYLKKGLPVEALLAAIFASAGSQRT